MDFFYLCDSLGENTYYVRIGRHEKSVLFNYFF